MKPYLFCICLAVNSLFSLHLKAQTVTNGSVTGAPAANSGIGAGNAAGWTGCGFSPDLCNTTFPSYSGNSQVARISSPDGGTWLGIAALGECAQTTITGLTPGTAYNLRFCGANFGTAALFNGSPAAPVVSVGAASVTLSIPQVANTWNPYQLIFTATAATMTLVCSIPSGSNSYASLDGFNLTGALCNPIILPIDFLRFDGEFRDCKVVLDWEGPETEITNAYEVQRSADGELFETLDKLQMDGKKTAHWEDKFPLESAFYRIRMYNETGRVAESPIVPIIGKCETPTVIVLGNPVMHSDIALLKFTAQKSTVRIWLIDASGREAGRYEMTTMAGSWNEFAMPVQDLRAGIYVVHTSDGAMARMVVQ